MSAATLNKEGMIDWAFWRLRAYVKDWKAAALSIGLDPDSMKHHPEAWMAGTGKPLFRNDAARMKFAFCLRPRAERALSGCSSGASARLLTGNRGKLAKDFQRIQTCHRDARDHTTRTIQSIEYVYCYRLTFVAAECRRYSSRCKRGWRARSSEVEVQQEITGTGRSNRKLYRVCAAR
jgi:hypothetical protein